MAPLRWEGGPEGGSPAEDCRDRAAGVAAAEVGSDAAADAAADVGTEAASESPADWPPGTKKAGAAVPLAANAPACSTFCFITYYPWVARQPACSGCSRAAQPSDDQPTRNHTTSQLHSESLYYSPGGGAKAAERSPPPLLPPELRGSTYRERTPRSGGAADAEAAPVGVIASLVRAGPPEQCRSTL